MRTLITYVLWLVLLVSAVFQMSTPTGSVVHEITPITMAVSSFALLIQDRRIRQSTGRIAISVGVVRVLALTSACLMLVFAGRDEMVRLAVAVLCLIALLARLTEAWAYRARESDTGGS